MAIIALLQRLHKPLEAELTATPLVMDNDGVMVPLRPEGGQPPGKRHGARLKWGCEPVCASPSKVLLFFGNFVPLARRRDPVKEGQGCRWQWGKSSNRLWNSDRSV